MNIIPQFLFGKFEILFILKLNFYRLTTKIVDHTETIIKWQNFSKSTTATSIWKSINY